jgi:hypothetical protein
MIVNKTVYCDCDGDQKMAEIVGENLVIKDRRHGQKHMAIISISSLMDYLTEQAILDNLKKRGYILNDNLLIRGMAETAAGQGVKPAVPTRL